MAGESECPEKNFHHLWGRNKFDFHNTQSATADLVTAKSILFGRIRDAVRRRSPSFPLLSPSRPSLTPSYTLSISLHSRVLRFSSVTRDMRAEIAWDL